MHNLKLVLIGFVALFVCSCSSKPSKEMLFGTWNYTKVENLKNPDENPADWELAEAAPSITFQSDSKMYITWGKKKLSYGTYTLEGDIIRITEALPEGKRKFPFIIKDLSEDKLVFETMTGLATRVTAKKVPE